VISRWGMVAVAAAVGLGLAACDTDDFGTTGAQLPTDVSQDSLEVEAPDLLAAQVAQILPDTLQSFDLRSRLFLGHRTRDNFRASPVIRFDFRDETLRESLRVAMLERLGPQEEFRIPIVEAFVDTVTIVPELFAGAVLQLEVLARDIDREVTVDDATQKRFPRPIRVFEASRQVSGADVAVIGSVVDIQGDELTIQQELSVEAKDIEAELPIDVVADWAAAGSHDGIVVFDDGDGAVQYDLPGDSNLLGLVSENGGTGAQIDLDIDVSQLPAELEFAAEEVVVETPALVDFTVFEKDAPLADEPVLGSHVVRRTWMQLDLGSNPLPPNATINQAIMQWIPRVDLNLGTTSSALDSTQLTVICYESLLSEATRTSPGSTNSSEGLVALTFIGQSGYSPALADTFEIDVTRYVQRVVNSIIDPDQTGLLLQFEDAFGAELTDYDQGVFYGPSAAESLQPRVRVTYTPPADSWR